ncbi:N-acetylmuramoyl-L-alanine amidase [Streptomyces sp. NPDC050534]|uniref:N-acetylmuramoyl-L-alanine amidase n=1 Tax=Streptomyces sp. NPDC050534 TaxID=3365625 RepID=UPI0037A629BB
MGSSRRSGRWPHGRPGRRSVLLGGAAVLGTGLSAAAALHAVPARAAVRPPIAGCDEWGARPPTLPVTVYAARPHKVIVHHTASPNSEDDSQAHAYALARSIQDAHLGRGWIDSGQHFTISRYGQVMEGRHRSLETLFGGAAMVESAHTTAQNTVAIGIENEGTYDTAQPPSELYASLVELCVAVCTRYGLRAYQIYGHRDFTDTDCPGDQLHDRLPRLRADVASRIGGSPVAPAWPTLTAGARGERVRSVQFLLRQHGSALTVTGTYDTATAQAVHSFQGAVKARVDGVAGQQTWNQLVAPLALGGSGEAVRAVQSQLAAYGSDVRVDGAFGPATRSAVASFQAGASLPSDGVVDARTWAALVT